MPKINLQHIPRAEDQYEEILRHEAAERGFALRHNVRVKRAGGPHLELYRVHDHPAAAFTRAVVGIRWLREQEEDLA